MNIDENVRNNVKRHLTEDNFRFETVENEAAVEELAQILETQHKPLNSIQKQKGFEKTAYLRK